VSRERGSRATIIASCPFSIPRPVSPGGLYTVVARVVDDLPTIQVSNRSLDRVTVEFESRGPVSMTGYGSGFEHSWKFKFPDGGEIAFKGAVAGERGSRIALEDESFAQTVAGRTGFAPVATPAIPVAGRR
jgi:hypothetical protein